MIFSIEGGYVTVACALLHRESYELLWLYIEIKIYIHLIRNLPQRGSPHEFVTH